MSSYLLEGRLNAISRPSSNTIQGDPLVFATGEHAMKALVETLVEQAKTLTAEERAELLDALFELVSPVDRAWEQAWIEECEGRMAAIDRGEMALIEADEVMARYRR